MAEENKENKQKKFYNQWWFWVIVAVLIIGIGGSSSMNNNTVKSSSTSSTGAVLTNDNKTETINYTPIDVDELENALTNNAAAAKDNYKGKYLEITGKLGTIDADLKYISLDSTTKEFDLSGIHCSIKNNDQKEIIKTLSRGDTIIVKGKITDVGEVLGYYLDIAEINK